VTLIPPLPPLFFFAARLDRGGGILIGRLLPFFFSSRRKCEWWMGSNRRLGSLFLSLLLDDGRTGAAFSFFFFSFWGWTALFSSFSLGNAGKEIESSAAAFLSPFFLLRREKEMEVALLASPSFFPFLILLPKMNAPKLALLLFHIDETIDLDTFPFFEWG